MPSFAGNWTFKPANTCWIHSPLDSKVSISFCKFFLFLVKFLALLFENGQWKHHWFEKISLSNHPLQACCCCEQLLNSGVVSFLFLIFPLALRFYSYSEQICISFVGLLDNTYSLWSHLLPSRSHLLYGGCHLLHSGLHLGASCKFLSQEEWPKGGSVTRQLPLSVPPKGSRNLRGHLVAFEMEPSLQASNSTTAPLANAQCLKNQYGPRK